MNILPCWKIFRNVENKNGKISNFIKTTKSLSPTSNSGAAILPPIVISFMFSETSGGTLVNGVFVCFERTDNIAIVNIRFYSNRFSF